jgi:hypothetical protein
MPEQSEQWQLVGGVPELYERWLVPGRGDASGPASIARSSGIRRRTRFRHFGEGASRAKRAEHSLAGVRMLCALFADAGFAEVCAETVTRNVHFESVGEYVPCSSARRR